MEKYGVADVDPEKWYPEHLLLDALNELAANPNVTPNMVAMGMQVGSIVPMPPELVNPTLEQVLRAWNGVYQSLHRNGDVGTITVDKIDEKHFRIIFDELYPDDFSYGILYGYARRFLPNDTQFVVYYDEQVIPRDRGGEEDVTIIHITWT
jgi:hypothetical protein